MNLVVVLMILASSFWKYPVASAPIDHYSRPSTYFVCQPISSVEQFNRAFHEFRKDETQEKENVIISRDIKNQALLPTTKTTEELNPFNKFEEYHKRMEFTPFDHHSEGAAQHHFFAKKHMTEFLGLNKKSVYQKRGMREEEREQNEMDKEVREELLLPAKSPLYQPPIVCDNEQNCQTKTWKHESEIPSTAEANYTIDNDPVQIVNENHQKDLVLNFTKMAKEAFNDTQEDEEPMKIQLEVQPRTLISYLHHALKQVNNDQKNEDEMKLNIIDSELDEIEEMLRLKEVTEKVEKEAEKTTSYPLLQTPHTTIAQMVPTARPDSIIFNYRSLQKEVKEKMEDNEDLMERHTAETSFYENGTEYENQTEAQKTITENVETTLSVFVENVTAEYDNETEPLELNESAGLLIQNNSSETITLPYVSEQLFNNLTSNETQLIYEKRNIEETNANKTESKKLIDTNSPTSRKWSYMNYLRLGLWK